MRFRLPILMTAGLAVSLTFAGCAGGWRNGAPALATESSTSPTLNSVAAPGNPVGAAEQAVFVWKGEGGTVAVAGEFNAWNTSADPLVKQADGSWKLVKKLSPGRYAYKYVIDGGTWKEDPTAKETVDDGYGAKNAVLVIGGAPGGIASASTSMSAGSAASGGKGKAPAFSTDGVTFVFAGSATAVHVAGDFNAWSMSADPLAQQPDGTWAITKKIPAGTYGYKFVINGSTWKTDESNPEGKDDGFGGKNSVVVVP